ncbi:hypothetical protein FRC01_004144 [Tulasnella sp. 417]|nr:hypothetical protein FRC01_004144 [Tulasnella sp. 417]
MPEQTGTVGYYRLYCPSGAIFSLNPIYENDISLSSFLIEHVQPPHSARDYITHIAQREWIKPSGIKMYITVPGASPELVSNLDMSGGPKYCGRSRERPFLIFVEPNNDLGRSYPSQSRLTSLPYRDLKTELPRAYYRLFGVAPSSTGTQRPIPSHHPLYEDDLSLSTLFVDHVPPPHRAKDYVACIAEREQIHPSRITLYLSAKAIGVSMTAEAQEIEDLEEIMAAEIMSSTSESDPIMVNVQLDDGSLRLGTKGEPLRLSVKARVRKLADVLLK